MYKRSLTWGAVPESKSEQTRWGVPEKRETGIMDFLTEEKPFCDLSLTTVLALEEVSVAANCRGTKEYRKKTTGFRQEKKPQQR